MLYIPLFFSRERPRVVELALRNRLDANVDAFKEAVERFQTENVEEKEYLAKLADLQTKHRPPSTGQQGGESAAQSSGNNEGGTEAPPLPGAEVSTISKKETVDMADVEEEEQEPLDRKVPLSDHSNAGDAGAGHVHGYGHSIDPGLPSLPSLPNLPGLPPSR